MMTAIKEGSRGDRVSCVSDVKRPAGGLLRQVLLMAKGQTARCLTAYYLAQTEALLDPSPKHWQSSVLYRQMGKNV